MLTGCSNNETTISTDNSGMQVETSADSQREDVPDETTSTTATMAEENGTTNKSGSTTATKKPGSGDKPTKSPAATTSAIIMTTTRSTTTTSNVPVKPQAAKQQTLANTKYLLTKKKAFNIAYFGGSITNGTGASNQEATSWRALTTAWLKKTYPNASITEINAARGGTSTYFGKMRVDFDLLNHDPDMVFIEFIVNDSFDLETWQSKINLETIIRKCYEKNPAMDIVLIYTCTTSSGSVNEYSDAFDEVAKHYGLTAINTAAALEKSGGDITTYFTKDRIHPNDAGYKVMADEVIAQMKALLKKASSPITLEAHTIPDPLSPDSTAKIQVFHATAIQAQNPSQEIMGPVDYARFDNIRIRPGDTITFTFTGKAIGVYWRCLSPYKETITCTLDGKDKQIISITSTDNSVIRPLYDDLERTTHTVTMLYRGKADLVMPMVFITE